MPGKMTQAARLDQVEALLNDDGVTLETLIAALQLCRTQVVRVVTMLCREGRAFRARVKLDDEAPNSSRYALFFRTAEARDAHEAAYNARMKERMRERQRVYSNDYKQRNADKLKQKRAAARPKQSKREAAYRERQRVKRETAEQTAQRRIMRAAEAELAKQQARLAREAAAADKQREKAEAASLKARLKAETKAAGKIVPLKGTASPKPAPVRGPAHLSGPADVSRAKVTELPTPPGRYAVADAPPLFSSLRPGQYIAKAPGWVEAVAA